MPFRKHHAILTFILVIVLGANFLSVRPVHADGETPTEPAAPTQVATEPPVESTPEPVEVAPEPVEATATPLAEVLTEAPENVEIVVLDENGDSVPLASQEAAEIAEATDPMWCPEGVLPGGTGCSVSYTTIGDLLNNMVSNTAFYSQNGVIYFTADPGTGTFNFSPTTLTGDYDTLKNYNLTLQGGWNGDTVSPSLSGQTDFSNHPITIGTLSNPWVGNIIINDATFTGASQTSLSVHTTSGSITLNNVDVNNQAGGNNTAFLNSASGNINVSNGTFDGNGTNSAGFSATTVSGAITISDSTFTDNKKSGTANNSDGATLSGLIVTLTNVTATNNDGDGITINSNTGTLSNVVASNNGTDPPGPVSNDGSGVFFNGAAGSNLFVSGGAFNNNKEYGIELANPASTTIHVSSAPTCTGNTLGCTNGTFLTDTTAPVLTLPADITAPATGPTGAVVNYSASATDNVDPALPVACLPPSGSTFPVGATIVICSATDTAGNTAIGTFQVTITDTTVIVIPTPTPPAGTPGSTPGSSTSQSTSTELIIPVTGGKVIRLDCNSAFWAYGIKLSFMNLCDYQTILDNVSLDNLPGALPEGYSFVMGLDLSLLSGDQAVEDLPDGTGIQFDFPLLEGSKDQFAVLHWNGDEWVEVSQQISNDKVAQFVIENSDTELYQIETALETFYQVLTTNETGIFVLVKK